MMLNSLSRGGHASRRLSTLVARNHRQLLRSTERHFVTAAAVCAPSLYFAPSTTSLSCESTAIQQQQHHSPIHPAALWADASATEKLRRVWRLCRRVWKLLWSLFPVVALYPIYALTAPNETTPNSDAHVVLLQQDDASTVDGWLGWYLRVCLHCVEQSGAAVIKLTQWASSRPDLFGHAACAVLSSLQDDTTPHSLAYTHSILEQTYGKDWRDKIELGDLLGSGCIGQVYRGTARGSQGESLDVAVKILHPSICEDIEADLDILRVLVRALKYVPIQFIQNLKWLNMEGVVEEFSGLLKLQIDLRNEAQNLERFNENFSGHTHIDFPKLVSEYEPAERVLVETFCEGIPVMQFCREHQNDQELLTKLCKTAIECVCKMIFLDNFVHGTCVYDCGVLEDQGLTFPKGDMHPGNIFVSQDGKKFILLDLGIVNQYKESDHQVIVDVLAAFIRRQGRIAGRLMIDDSNNRLKGDASALQEEKYIDKIEALTIKAGNSGYFMESLGSYISYICDAAATHQVLLNPSFVSAALAVKVEEVSDRDDERKRRRCSQCHTHFPGHRIGHGPFCRNSHHRCSHYCRVRTATYRPIRYGHIQAKRDWRRHCISEPI